MMDCFDLQLFAGGAGAAGAGATGGAGMTGGDGAAGATGIGDGAADGYGKGSRGEETALAEPAPKKSRRGKKANPLKDVQYGIREDPEEAAGAADEGNGPEGGAGEGTEDERDTDTFVTEKESASRQAAFEELIQGEYRDLFEDRLRSVREEAEGRAEKLTEQAKALSPLISLLSSKYGVEDGDLEGLVKAVEDDDAYYEEEAMREGLTVAQLKQMKRMERENAELRAAREEMERRREADQIYSRWMAESEEVKKIYPSFDLGRECQNEDFIKMLRSGVGLKAAYQALHMDELLGGAMQYTAKEVARHVTENIRARGERPVENGLSAGSAAITKTDVTKLTKRDREEIERRVLRGEIIKF